ncbi:hypothetical protein HDU96_002709 [Phlyctochytrium bullatum]|nr:hypothetical protein HDU96_002709 [Phlyctochytrium bullatum]
MASPHIAALDTGLAFIKELLASSDFVPHSEAKGTKISMKTPPGAVLPITRGETVFPAKFTVDEILAVIRSPEDRKLWDGRFENAEILEEYSAEEGLLHSYQKGQWPVISGRDFIVAFKVYTEGDTKYLIQTSVTVPSDPRCAEVKGRVRGTVTAGWILKPSATEPGATDVIYIVNADPAGTLPAALVKMVSAETPACAGGVRELMEKRKK